MANYVREKGIDVGYELWRRGFRLNTRVFREVDFVRKLNEANERSSKEVTFDMFFQAILWCNPEWLIDEVAEEKAYKLENEPKIRKYFFDNFFGKTISQIRADARLSANWDFYSDWHKDVFGYRPCGVVCGIDTSRG